MTSECNLESEIRSLYILSNPEGVCGDRYDVHHIESALRDFDALCLLLALFWSMGFSKLSLWSTYFRVGGHWLDLSRLLYPIAINAIQF